MKKKKNQVNTYLKNKIKIKNEKNAVDTIIKHIEIPQGITKKIAILQPWKIPYLMVYKIHILPINF